MGWWNCLICPFVIFSLLLKMVDNYFQVLGLVQWFCRDPKSQWGSFPGIRYYLMSSYNIYCHTFPLYCLWHIKSNVVLEVRLLYSYIRILSVQQSKFCILKVDLFLGKHLVLALLVGFLNSYGNSCLDWMIETCPIASNPKHLWTCS